MPRVSSKQLLRVALIIGVLGIGLWRFMGVAEGQDAAPQSIYLPSVASSSFTGIDNLIYDFGLDTGSSNVWTNIQLVFTRFSMAIAKENTNLVITEDKHGASQKVATVRCVGIGCSQATSVGNSASAPQASDGQTWIVQLDESRRLVFTSLAANKLDLDIFVDGELAQQLTIMCDVCTIDVIVAELFDSPTATATRTDGAGSETSTPTVTPTPTTTGSGGAPTATVMPTVTVMPTATSSAPVDGNDKLPPIISNVVVMPSANTAMISWKTNEPATSNVQFGTTAGYELAPLNDPQLVTNHSVQLTGLMPETVYHFQISSTDANGNVAVANDATFTTTSASEVPAGAFVETFDGDPDSPTPWHSSQWDITVHSRDRETYYQLESMQAQHGENCEAPPLTHTVSAYEDAVFQCRNHLMTAINASGYGLIYLTPAYQIDFSNGTATLRFDMSTLRTSERDWVDIYISPMEDHLQLALEDWLPDLSGEPKNAIKVRMEEFDGNTNFSMDVIKDFEPQGVNSTWWIGYEQYLEPSAMMRSTFELQVSRTHLKFGIPDYDFWWVDTDIEPLDWSVGVVQFGHHSYTPTKDCMRPGGCSPNTWHWDNVSINPARPFTMIHATQRYADEGSPVVNFDAPSPENAFLRFAGIGNGVEVSFDNGKTWHAAQGQEQIRHIEENFWSYFTPIPAGVQSVKFRAQDWWGGTWMARDISIWAK